MSQIKTKERMFTVHEGGKSTAIQLVLLPLLIEYVETKHRLDIIEAEQNFALIMIRRTSGYRDDAQEVKYPRQVTLKIPGTPKGEERLTVGMQSVSEKHSEYTQLYAEADQKSVEARNAFTTARKTIEATVPLLLEIPERWREDSLVVVDEKYFFVDIGYGHYKGDKFHRTIQGYEWHSRILYNGELVHFRRPKPRTHVVALR